MGKPRWDALKDNVLRRRPGGGVFHRCEQLVEKKAFSFC
jgi:hypothetical protein